MRKILTLPAAILALFLVIGEDSPSSPVGQARADGVGLKLDDAMLIDRSTSSELTGGALQQFGMSDLRHRLRAANESIEQLARLKMLSERQLRDREALVADLQRLIETQEEAIFALREQIRLHSRTAGLVRDVERGPRLEAPGDTAPAVAAALTGPHSSARTLLAGGEGVWILEEERWFIDASLLVLVIAALTWALSTRARLQTLIRDSLHPDARALQRIADKTGAVRPRVGPAKFTTLRATSRPDGRASGASGAGARAAEPGSVVRASDANTGDQGGGVVVSGLAGAARAPELAETSGNAPGQTMEAETRDKAGGLEALREVDTMIAFEDFQQAARTLSDLVASEPTNPEYRVRLLHVERELGNVDRAVVEEEFLKRLTSGSRSAGLVRAGEIGRSLLPGHPLFLEPPFTQDELVGEAVEPIPRNSDPATIEVAPVGPSPDPRVGGNGNGAPFGREFALDSDSATRLETR